jgi:AraC-like DNA-binding protein
MSRRTLARRLSSEGLTFAGVLADLRDDLAKCYLRDEDLAISQIAWLLGYQEISAFTHAFKRRTGKTPREARSAKTPLGQQAHRKNQRSSGTSHRNKVVARSA